MTKPARSAVLAEMGLTPLWRLRGPAAGAAEAAVADGDAATEPRSPPAAAPPGAPGARAATIGAMDWTALKQAVPACTACGLHAGRRQAVIGVGDERADWLLVGEAPGAEEDRLGEPFVGQAGRLLDAMLAALALKRGQNVYIANVLKCRPPGNRNPEPAEVAQCTPYLLRQIALIEPRLIVAMGRFAAQTLLATDATIASLRGRVHRYAGVPLIVTYHPAYLLRNLPDKAKAWSDLLFARRTLTERAAG
jgi:uracil-DNA glycosylase family 4